jgi:hypothetical protein
MTEVLVSSEELTVLGGPTSLEVNVDFGPRGQRGSLFFVGFGNPNDSLTDPDNISGTEVLEKDIFINISRSDDEFSFLYQYTNNQWEVVADILPTIFADNVSRTFTDGECEILLNVNNVVNINTAQNLSASNFNVQYNILNSEVLASSMSIGEITTNGSDTVLPLTIKAAKFDGFNWYELDSIDGTKNIHISVTIVV